jgi:preprotein translocase subunit YajC
MEIAVLALVMVLGLGAYWAMVVYPKQRDFTKRQRYVRSLAIGDEVVTYGGLIGKVVDVEADKGIAHLEIAEGVVVRCLAAAMTQPYDPEAFARAAQVTADESGQEKPES